MCPGATTWANWARRAGFLALAPLPLLVPAGVLSAQEGAGTRLDWRQFGNLSITGPAVAGLASGPVNRVWYSSTGDRLAVLTAAGQTWETADFESWKSAALAPPSRVEAEASALPEPGAHVQAAGPRFVKGLVYLGWGKVAALAGIRPPGVPGSPGYRQGTTRGHAGPAADCDAPSWSLPGTRAGGRAGPAESPRCSRTESRSAWCPDGRSWSETLSGGWAVREALLWNLGITTFLSRPASE